MNERRNINRGFQKLRVWQDAIEYYRLTYSVFKEFTACKIAGQAMACADSIHRNIAEGYSRRSIKEYMQFLRIALASAAESASGLHAYVRSGQISTEQFEELDALAYKIENELIRLVEQLEVKQTKGDWIDTFVKEPETETYNAESSPTP
jgi:four helix bundle protein